jgi:thiol-disulfide isomerase/thioredoxin
MTKKKPNNKKSDLIFWGVGLGLIAFLFLTPWGMEVRAWLQSWTLWSPDTEENAIQNTEEQVIGYDWMFISDDGTEVYISDFDKPIFLNFWATWCGPCRSELSSILDLKERYEGKVDFILLSPSENLSTIQEFKKKEEWDFPVYVNGSYLPENLGVEVFPTTYIIDGNKQIQFKFEGAYDWDTEEVHEMLDKML